MVAGRNVSKSVWLEEHTVIGSVLGPIPYVSAIWMLREIDVGQQVTETCPCDWMWGCWNFFFKWCSDTISFPWNPVCDHKAGCNKKASRYLDWSNKKVRKRNGTTYTTYHWQPNTMSISMLLCVHPKTKKKNKKNNEKIHEVLVCQHTVLKCWIVYVSVCLSNFRTFANFSLRTSTFHRNSTYSDTGSPAGHIGLGLGAIRALWSAWRALKNFSLAGVDIIWDDFPGFSTRGFLYVRTFEMSSFFLSFM